MSPATQSSELIHLEFDDNKLLPPLYGEHDRNLARIEQSLQVAVASRGNRLAISGPVSSVEAARSALTLLYDRLKRGLDVGPADVDGAIRLAVAAMARPGDTGGDDALTIRTRKRAITPRSPVQADYIRALRSHDLIFGLGPAGTGKTYLAVAAAVEMMAA